MTPRAPEPGDIPPYRPQLLRDDSTHSKLSVPLSSQSNEADDEQSSDPEDPDFDMESSADSPQYEGEDTRLTSDKELSGFYMYGWAAEVCALLTFISLLCIIFVISCRLSASYAPRSGKRQGPSYPKLHHSSPNID